jgi:AraC-like DNA-binding protein
MRLPERGILRPDDDAFQLRRDPPSPDLAAFVERHWTVEWDRRGQPPHTVEVLPYPCVNLVLARGVARLHGVGRKRFAYVLEGRDSVFGVKFRPGGFHPFLGSDVSALTDRAVPVEEVFGAAGAAFAEALAGCHEREGRITLAEDFLRGRRPKPDPRAELAAGAVGLAMLDESIDRVGELAARCGTTPRALQRLFQAYVGVPPKWVLQRRRLQAAAARLEQGAGGLAALALDLGYFDQAHLTREFGALVGRPPARYAVAADPATA